jgi:hypothetical protein
MKHLSSAQIIRLHNLLAGASSTFSADKNPPGYCRFRDLPSRRYSHETFALRRHRHQLISNRDHVPTADFYFWAQRIQSISRALWKCGSHSGNGGSSDIPAVGGEDHAIADRHTHFVCRPVTGARVRLIDIEPLGRQPAIELLLNAGGLYLGRDDRCLRCDACPGFCLPAATVTAESLRGQPVYRQLGSLAQANFALPGCCRCCAPWRSP